VLRVNEVVSSIRRVPLCVCSPKCWSPTKGRVYDPCCGSGGMFVQSEKFVVEHGGRIGGIRVYGQEMNNTTWRLAINPRRFIIIMLSSIHLYYIILELTHH
jgi:hypothetical protein